MDTKWDDNEANSGDDLSIGDPSDDDQDSSDGDYSSESDPESELEGNDGEQDVEENGTAEIPPEFSDRLIFYLKRFDQLNGNGKVCAGELIIMELLVNCSKNEDSNLKERVVADLAKTIKFAEARIAGTAAKDSNMFYRNSTSHKRTQFLARVAIIYLLFLQLECGVRVENLEDALDGEGAEEKSELFVDFVKFHLKSAYTTSFINRSTCKLEESKELTAKSVSIYLVAFRRCVAYLRINANIGTLKLLRGDIRIFERSLESIRPTKSKTVWPFCIADVNYLISIWKPKTKSELEDLLVVCLMTVFGLRPSSIFAHEKFNGILLSDLTFRKDAVGTFELEVRIRHTKTEFDRNFSKPIIYKRRMGDPDLIGLLLAYLKSRDVLVKEAELPLIDPRSTNESLFIFIKQAKSVRIVFRNVCRILGLPETRLLTPISCRKGFAVDAVLTFLMIKPYATMKDFEQMLMDTFNWGTAACMRYLTNITNELSSTIQRVRDDADHGKILNPKAQHLYLTDMFMFESKYKRADENSELPYTKKEKAALSEFLMWVRSRENTVPALKVNQLNAEFVNVEKMVVDGNKIKSMFVRSCDKCGMSCRCYNDYTKKLMENPELHKLLKRVDEKNGGSNFELRFAEAAGISKDNLKNAAAILNEPN